MDRRNQLSKIYQESGLAKVLGSRGVNYHADENFTKLQFLRNDFRLRSIEIKDLQNGGFYFRIHHADDAPSWLMEELGKLPGAKVRTSAKFGINLEGDPLALAAGLAKVLQSRQ